VRATIALDGQAPVSGVVVLVGTKHGHHGTGR
jgi:hypothetical protein